MTARREALVIALSTVVAAALVLTLPAQMPIRVAAGLALVLVLPGAGLRLALLPSIARLAAIPASIALGALAAVLLDALGVQLETQVWTIALAVLAVLGGLAGALRATDTPTATDAPPADTPPARPSRLLVIACSVGAVFLLAAAIVITSISAHDQVDRVRFTQLSATPGPASTVDVSVRSDEKRTRRWVLVLAVGSDVRSSPPFELRPGAIRSVSVPAPRTRKLRVALNAERFSAPPSLRVEYTPSPAR